MSDKDDYRTIVQGVYDYLIGATSDGQVEGGNDRSEIQATSSTSLAAAREAFRRTPPDLTTAGHQVYNSYAGVDIIATVVLPGNEILTLGEVQTISYSMHRENTPVRFLGHVNPAGFVKGPRTLAGSLIFTNFNNYAFYRLQQFRTAVVNNLYPVADMLPPFDVVLTFTSEMGAFSKMKIYGVTIVDEGGTMSIDDLITESTYSFMARGIQPLTGYMMDPQAYYGGGYLPVETRANG